MCDPRTGAKWRILETGEGYCNKSQGHREDVKAVKAHEMGYGDKNGSNDEVSREKNGLNGVENALLKTTRQE